MEISSLESERTTTRDYIAFHALLHPSDIAVIDGGHEYTFENFNRHLDRFILALQSFDLEVGQSVAIEWKSLYLHWLLVLAFETLGVKTFTFTKDQIAKYRSVFTDMTLILCTEDAVPDGASRVHLITQNWVDEVEAQEPKLDFRGPVLKPDSALRIHHSSGTTGEAKRISRTVQELEFRYWLYQIKVGYNRHSRYLVHHPFSVQTIYGNATACIRMGGTCILDSNDTVQTISGHKVTHVSMLPVVLANTLGRLPKDYEKSTNLTVLVFGAPLSEQLRTRALQDFATDIIASYGTTETASICAIRPDGTGTVFPGVTVEVVDETDRPLIGQPGRVRVKSAGCISGYEDNPDATERMFKNGWFYPGDVGVMNGIRSLKLLGRVDNLINVGGIKLDSEKVEDELRGIISVNDLCVTTIPNTDGIHRVYIAVVLGSSTKLKDLMEAITSNKNMDLGKFILVEVKEIPRSGPGKVQREKLRELILDSTKQAIGP